MCLNKTTKAFMCLKYVIFPVLKLLKLFMCLFFSPAKAYVLFLTVKALCASLACAYKKWVYVNKTPETNLKTKLYFLLNATFSH